MINITYDLQQAKNYFFLFCLIFLSSIQLQAQSGYRDSMFLQGQAFFNQMVEGYYTESPQQLISYLKEAKICFKAAENWDYYIATLNYLSSFYYREKELVNFDQSTREAIETAEQQFGKNSANYISALNNRSVLYKLKGDYANALEKYFESIDLVDPEAVNKNALEAVGYQNIGIVYKETGDFAESFRHLYKALTLRLEVDNGNDANIPGIYRDLAQSFKEAGQIDSAQTLYQLSLEKLEGLKDLNDYTDQITLHCLQGIAEINLEQQNWEGALKYARQAIQFQKGKKQFDDHISYQILGRLFTEKGAYDQALEAHQNALAAAEKEFEIYERHPEVAICQENIGKVYLARQNFDQALAWFQKALISNTLDFDEPRITANPASHHFINIKHGLSTLEQKAKALRLRSTSAQKQNHDLKNAYTCYVSATDLISQLRKSYLAENSKHTLAAKALSIYEGAIETTLQLYNLSTEEQYKKAAFLFAEANKAVVLQESMSGVAAMGKADIPPNLLKKEDSLRIEITFYEQQINLARQKKDPLAHADLKEWEQSVFTLKKTHNELIAFFEEKFPIYYEEKYSTAPLSVDHLIQQMNEEQSAIIEFFIGEEKGYVFCLTGKGVEVHPISANASSKTKVRQLRELLVHAPRSESFLEDFEAFGQLSHQLYQALLAPCILQLPAEVNRLCIIPDDILGYLPFELLLMKAAPGREQADYSLETLNYLMEDYDINYNYSASLMLNNKATGTSNAAYHFLGMAPGFGKEIAAGERSCSPDQLYSLQCSGEEVASINQLVDGDIFVDYQAEKAVFLEKAKDYRICHLATHACLDDRNTQLNRIYFSDDYLSAYELYNLQLNAELVVLSACNTGSGQMVKGEGVMSLSRGFIHAGCPSTLTSLWAVDDCATSSIMRGFYQAYANGMRKDKALQQAKEAYLAGTTNKLYRHPYYWSAFIQLGNTDTASFYQAWWQKPFFWLIAVALLILGVWASRQWSIEPV